jgi:TPP-dependent pyruvate/acetoin dehydrogenase alpha subunit
MPSRLERKPHLGDDVGVIDYRWLLARMRLIRRFEEAVVGLYPTDVMVTPVHLHIGQEAVPVGLCAHLRPEDTIFFGHRTHGPALAKGLDPKRLMAELYGRTTGCSQGYGGSMHLVDPANGMLGSSAIVGGGISLGVGSALAAKLAGEDRISVSFFGDAATDSGAFWESLNFAALKGVPVLFVCENNDLSNTMRQKEHMHADITAAAAQFMLAQKADGTDVLDVHEKVGRALARVRGEGQPALVECRTKRWMKHQGIERDDLAYNPVDEARDCPIRKLEAHVLEHGLLTPADLSAIDEGARTQVADAIAFAVASPFPTASDLIREV